MIYIDFSEACYMIPFGKLIRAHGIQVKLANWTLKWLGNKGQRMTMRVAHMIVWSLLGTLLFVIYVNDFYVDFASKICKFDKDMKFGRVADSGR